MNSKNNPVPDLQSLQIQDLKRIDRDRFLASSFAPQEKRSGLLALLAFNAELSRVREMVTQPMLGQIRLQWWRDVLDEIYAGNTVRRHPVAQILADCINRYGLTRLYLQQLIDSREQDLVEVPFADVTALDAYAAGTGGALSAARLEVLGAVDPASTKAGQEVGAAWALTGIIRAIPFHARFRRILLPADRLRDAGVDTEALFAGHPQSCLWEATVPIVELAREHLERGRALRSQIDRAALPVLQEARLAERYLNGICQAAYDPFDAALSQSLPLASWYLLAGFWQRKY